MMNYDAWRATEPDFDEDHSPEEDAYALGWRDGYAVGIEDGPDDAPSVIGFLLCGAAGALIGYLAGWLL